MTKEDSPVSYGICDRDNVELSIALGQDVQITGKEKSG